MSDRKYRHSGYQDSGTRPSGPRAPRTPQEPRIERLEGAPRGRSTGGFGPEVFRCNRCGAAVRSLGEIEIEPSSQCECGADLHTCSNCPNFNTAVHWECRESERIPARVSRKDERNDCPIFTPKVVRDLSADKGRSGAVNSADDARKAFENLFKK